MIAHTKTLLNAQLKQVLSAENLKVSGVKSDLQIRIISREFGLLPLLLPLPLHAWRPPRLPSRTSTYSRATDIERLAYLGDYDALQRVRRRLYGQYIDYSNHSSPSTSYTNSTPPSSASPSYHPPMPAHGHRGGMPPTTHTQVRESLGAGSNKD